jgi:hypothetical protein
MMSEAKRDDSELSALLAGWISVDEKLPDTTGHAYMCEMSESVLVRGEGKNAYPWVAHLHVDKAATYKTYAWGFDRENVRYTWLNPYRGIGENQKVTHWRPLTC